MVMDQWEPIVPEDHRETAPRIAELRMAKERERLLVEWLRGGGTEEEFEQAWPVIQAELSKSRVRDIAERARTRSLSLLKRKPSPGIE